LFRAQKNANPARGLRVRREKRKRSRREKKRGRREKKEEEITVYYDFKKEKGNWAFRTLFQTSHEMDRLGEAGRQAEAYPEEKK